MTGNPTPPVSAHAPSPQHVSRSPPVSVPAGRQVLAVLGAEHRATTTTTAVGIAMECARAGLEALLIDLNPNGGASEWLEARPWERGKDVGAILADPYPIGWASQLFTYTRLHPRLLCLPAPARMPRTVQRQGARLATDRLSLALTTSIGFDVVVIDSPPLATSPLVNTALHAATDVVLTRSGATTGTVGTADLLTAFQAASDNCGPIGAARLRGAVVGNEHGHTTTAVDESEHVLSPVIPHRQVVAQTRQTHEYFGTSQPDGATIARAYATLATQLVYALHR